MRGDPVKLSSLNYCSLQIFGKSGLRVVLGAVVPIYACCHLLNNRSCRFCRVASPNSSRPPYTSGRGTSRTPSGFSKGVLVHLKQSYRIYLQIFDKKRAVPGTGLTAEQLQDHLGLLVGLCQHSSGGLLQDAHLGELHHFSCHVHITDAGLGRGKVFRGCA